MSRLMEALRAVAELLGAEHPTVPELQPLKSALSMSQYAHAKRFVQDATRAFGEDSTMARVAKFGERMWDGILAMQGIDPQGMTSFWASAEGVTMMEREEAKLLAWAESFDSVSESG